MTMELPGYDAWKLEGPPELTAAEEREIEERREIEQQDLRDAIGSALADYRGELTLGEVREIVLDELGKLQGGASA